MNTVISFVKKNYVHVISVFVVISLFILMTVFWIKRGTFSLDDDSAKYQVNLSCPATAKAGEEILCDVILIATDDKIMSVNANYDFSGGTINAEYVSFGVNDQCTDDCFENLASTENGFAVVNMNGVDGTVTFGKLRVKFPENIETNTSYRIGLKNIELSNDAYLMIEDAIYHKSAEVRILDNKAELTSVTVNYGGTSKTILADEFTEQENGSFEYEMTVDANIDNIEGYTAVVNDTAEWIGITSFNYENGGKLNYGSSNVIYIQVNPEDEETSVGYNVRINRLYEFNTSVYTYNKSGNYIYTKNDSGNTIINNLEPLDSSLNYYIDNNKLQVIHDGEVLCNINILNFNSEYEIVDNQLLITGTVMYRDLKEKVTSDILSIKVIDNDSEEVTNDNVIITKDYTVNIYYNNVKLDSYRIKSSYLAFDDTLIVDDSNKIIKRLVIGRSYQQLLDMIDTDAELSITSKGNIVTNYDDIIKSTDVLNIKFSDGTTINYTLSVLGDLTGDGKIKINDVDRLYRRLKGKLELNDVYLAAADVVANGSIKINDVDRLYRYLKGKITSLEVVK